MNAEFKMHRLGLVLLGFIVYPMAARGDYHRLSLDEKVRLSDLIVVGSATELNERPPFSTATRRAVIKVDKVLKGALPEGDITIGYRSGDEIYDVNNKERVRLVENPIEVGKPCILFLRKAVTGTYAPVNWQYGIIPLADGKVTDPRWPSDEVGMVYRRFIKDQKLTSKNHPWDFRGQIPAEDALGHIRAAIKVADMQKDIGRMSINGAPSSVLWESSDQGYRLLVRVPKRSDCPSFDVSRVHAVLVPPSGDPIAPDGACLLEGAPESVDPISALEQLALSFPKKKEMSELKSVELLIDGQKRTFCINETSGCKSDSIGVRCAACRSQDTRPYDKITRSYADRPCGFSPDPLPVLDLDAKQSNLSHHCNTCEFEW